MSLNQIALAAECITLARLDFAQKVYLDPLLGLVQAVMKKKPETSAQRKSKKGKKQDQTREQKEAATMRALNALGILEEG